jgi:hypothetical protein
LAYLGSLGSDEEHLSFSVAASARPIRAGAAASQAVAATDDCRTTRRLIGFDLIMLLPVFSCTAVLSRRNLASA